MAVSNLEESDLNDSDILTRTTQKKDPNGNVQFFYVLPSGRKLNSEWVSPDNRKAALHQWVATMRAQILADLQASRRQKIEAAEAVRPKIILPEVPPPAGVLVEDTVKRIAEPYLPRDRPPQRQSDDPLEHAQQQLAVAHAELGHWTSAVADAEAKLKGAQKNYRKWSAIVTALGDDNGEDPEPS